MINGAGCFSDSVEVVKNKKEGGKQQKERGKIKMYINKKLYKLNNEYIIKYKN